jgi:hypothetical protein
MPRSTGIYIAQFDSIAAVVPSIITSKENSYPNATVPNNAHSRHLHLLVLINLRPQLLSLIAADAGFSSYTTKAEP